MEANNIKIGGKTARKITLGGAVLWENVPAWLREHCIVWYDIQRQNYTNAQFAEDPRLIDFSGHGNDADLPLYSGREGFKFDGESDGMTDDGWFRFKSGQQSAQITNTLLLRDFTLLFNMLPYANENWQEFATKMPTGDAKTATFFVQRIDANNTCEMISFGNMNTFRPVSSWPQFQWYCPEVCHLGSLTRGNSEDAACNINLMNNTPAYVRHIMIFDKTLTAEEINFVKTKIMNL